MKWKYDEEKNKLSIKLFEELDINSCRQVRTLVDGYMLKYSPKECEIDMSEVDFMDSSGIGFISGRYNLSKMLNCLLIIKNPSYSVNRMMDMSPLCKNIKVVKYE